VEEPIFRSPHQQFRPFSTSAGITARCCSLPLQRVVTDFGADHAFGRVPYKLQEHYGIDLSVSSIRAITLHHAEQMHEQQEMADEPSNEAIRHQLIAEMDGSMIPIVTVDEEAVDKRKNKTLHWQEGRLCLAHAVGSTTIKFGAVFNGSVDQAGEQWLNCARLVGFGKESHLHGIGDGAVWLERQFSNQFGEQGSYLVDFFHVCEYLGSAANSCSPENPKAWAATQKDYLKSNEPQRVLENLKPYLEASDIKDEKAPVRACHRYLSNRIGQLDYKTAIDKGLPIGSGEIESAHRYIIQERVKLPGAWWKAANVEPMLILRVVRANKQWGGYWQNIRKAA